MSWRGAADGTLLTTIQPLLPPFVAFTTSHHKSWPTFTLPALALCTAAAAAAADILRPAAAISHTHSQAGAQRDGPQANQRPGGVTSLIDVMSHT